MKLLLNTPIEGALVVVVVVVIIIIIIIITIIKIIITIIIIMLGVKYLIPCCLECFSIFA